MRRLDDLAPHPQLHTPPRLRLNFDGIGDGWTVDEQLAVPKIMIGWEPTLRRFVVPGRPSREEQRLTKRAREQSRDLWERSLKETDLERAVRRRLAECHAELTRRYEPQYAGYAWCNCVPGRHQLLVPAHGEQGC